MRLELMLSGVRRRDVILMEMERHGWGKLTHEWRGGPVAIVGFRDGMDEIQIKARKRGVPYLFIDHGYISRNPPIYDKFRLCVSHYHTRDFRPGDKVISHDAWKQGSDIIVLPPSPQVKAVYGKATWLADTLQILEQNTDRRIIVKEKMNGPLAPLLQNAHAVVSYGSVGEVEALRAGVPVFTTFGPSLPVAETDFSKIETPKRPDRAEWLSSLAAAEYSLNELDAAYARISPLLETAWQ